ncbi:phosphotransferase enzyme family protein [Streptomyces triculaminicus]|uniref:phosphotransferase enzyme family protein n=1 Tax=Streptomyces triculaminicus TaxID=2816232 RepID=UPI0037D44F97
MTTTTARPEDAAHAACRAMGLDTRGLASLRNHATAVFFLPFEDTVVRVSPSAKTNEVRTAVTLTRWLVDQGFPATEPLLQPVQLDAFTITFWKHYPQDQRAQPPAEHLGALLRQLHDLPPPPVDLPVYQPLASLSRAVASSTSLSQDIRTWLTETMTALLHAYEGLDSLLGTGLVHGDAYPGNTLWDGASVVRLGDWDEAAVGPRELDLANTLQGIRFGRSQQTISAFTRAYEYDPRTWDGLPVLIAIRDLHTLGSFIRRADTGDPQAGRQLQHRLDTLRAGNRSARWDTF